MNQTSLFEGAYRRAVLVAAAMALSLVAYVGVALVVRAAASPFRGFAPDLDTSLLRTLFLAASVALLGGAAFLRGRGLGADGSPTGADVSEARAAAVVAALTRVTILGLALAEAVALFGLVLFLLGGRDGDFGLFFLLSLVGFILFFPRRSHWEEIARRHGLVL